MIYELGYLLVVGLVVLAALAALAVGAGYFFHIGWNLYHPGY